jgi:hypothetical protein
MMLVCGFTRHAPLCLCHVLKAGAKFGQVEGGSVYGLRQSFALDIETRVFFHIAIFFASIISILPT